MTVGLPIAWYDGATLVNYLCDTCYFCARLEGKI